jgi:ribosomal protein L37E
MQQNTKKMVLIGFIVVCFVVAIAITFLTSPSRGRGGRTSRDEIWVICRNPQCQAQYQIEYNEYFQYMVKYRDRLSDTDPPMTCQRCGEPSVYQGIKCVNCGLVFEPGSLPNEPEDKCPKCGYSKLREQGKVRETQGASK